MSHDRTIEKPYKPYKSFITKDIEMTHFPIMGVPVSLLTQLAAAPGAKPELKFMASFAANSKRSHADRVRIVQNERLRQTKLSASITNQAPQADTERRLRVAQLNAISI